VSRHGVDHTKRFRGIGENALLAPRGLRRGADAVAGGAAGGVASLAECTSVCG
jgi:hypothetical protein